MYNTALRIVKNSAEAEDVMQESFISAFSKLDSLKDKATFGSWLKRIVINNSISQYNKSKHFIAIDENHYEEEYEEESFSISSEDLTSIKVAELLQCMESLTANYCQILTLHFIEGFDYEEICEILNISYANCRTLISRAKESLRKKLIINP
jgi:RNA polymerase sigma-70 factor (ECF subfamily)